jgi:hypothetical protein
MSGAGSEQEPRGSLQTRRESRVGILWTQF